MPPETPRILVVLRYLWPKGATFDKNDSFPSSSTYVQAKLTNNTNVRLEFQIVGKRHT